MNPRICVAASFLALACTLSAPVVADSGSHKMITPADLVWTDVASLPPGAKLAVLEGSMSEAAPFTVRIKVPANYKIPAHWHPVVERVTVISGTFYMGLGDKLDPDKSKGLTPGSMMILQPKTHHFAWTKEETTIQLHGTGPWAITYVNPADDPRKK